MMIDCASAGNRFLNYTFLKIDIDPLFMLLLKRMFQKQPHFVLAGTHPLIQIFTSKDLAKQQRKLEQ
jgi:hypothetical protein